MGADLFVEFADVGGGNDGVAVDFGLDFFGISFC